MATNQPSYAESSDVRDIYPNIDKYDLKVKLYDFVSDNNYYVHYNSGVVKDFIYGLGLRENYNGILLPAPAGCDFGPEIETWEEGWEKDNRVSFDKEKWYNSIRK